MLISLKWIRDYVDLPADLDPRELGERLTRTTAEVEGVESIDIRARGLIAARVQSVTPISDARHLKLALLEVGSGKTVETVTAAPVINAGQTVLYAPTGASVAKLGAINEAKVARRTSAGMILPSDAVGIAMGAQEAVFLGGDVAAGEAIESELFDDWVIEIDNKSLTHRPDLWGHYGIAREIAAIYGSALKAYPVADLNVLSNASLPDVPISIADSNGCRRYTGLVVEGVPTQPAPLWMQLRLGRIGLRPINGLVDLTNYIMADLGQPMHAFDAAKVNRIEVDWAAAGDRFKTLDSMDRSLTDKDLMILCGGKPIALAGVMGGLDTEVTDKTKSLLLESANFDPATIRRTATRLGLRTDASARFEKSLDPAHTALAIQRFVHLAEPIYPDLRLTSRLSDCYPSPQEAMNVTVNPSHVDRMIGRAVPLEEADGILSPLGFAVRTNGKGWTVSVPSFRATGDVSIEADVIEELARYIGFENIEQAMPYVAMRRFAPNALHVLQQATVRYFANVHGFNEIHGYLWYDAAWLSQIGIDPGPCVELVNPAAEGLHQFRRSLMPGMLAAVGRNRFHYSSFSLIELGSVFETGGAGDHEYHHLGLVAAHRGKRAEQMLYDRLKGSIEAWAWSQFTWPVQFARAAASTDRPWEHPQLTATVGVNGAVVGRISVIDTSLKRRMDDHLSAWSVVWAEIRLDGLEALEPRVEALGKIPQHPQVEMDFSIVVPKSECYTNVAQKLIGFDHGLIRQMRYEGSYEGDAIGTEFRSLLFRIVLGEETRTLVEEDTNRFRSDFETHLKQYGYSIRS